MTYQINWDTQPKAGWTEFQEARARFFARPRPDRFADPPFHTVPANGNAATCDGAANFGGDGIVTSADESDPS